jgi:hypothetical protein
MEYKLNKIDTELISRVNSTTKPGKIHKQNTVKFNVDKDKEQKDKNKNDANYKMEAYKKKEKEDINKEVRCDDGTGKYVYVRK